jgi:acetylornithine aminotransferase/acetylornithine/N-succinyldiaminopimelate aminotransferase
MHGTTFGGGPLACAVAAAFLDQLTETNLMAQVAKVGGYFKRRLDELAAKHSSIRKVRGLGLMLGVELDSADRAKAVLKEMLQRGVLLSRTHDVVMRFLPPFIITEEHVDEAVKALDASLAVPFQPASGQKTKARKS